MERWIVFYASDHGFGHLTRTMAIIEEVMKSSDYRISLVTGEKQSEFASLYLKNYLERIEIRSKRIDVGIICYEGSLEVDKTATEKNVRKYLGGMDALVAEEAAFYRGRDIVRVVTDISIAGIYLSRELGVPSVLISNFTWCEQYEHLDIDPSIIDVFQEAYSSCDRIIEYDVSLGMGRYGDTVQTGVLARSIDEKKVEELKALYGDILMVSCGKSATLSKVKIRNFPGTVIHTAGTSVETDSPLIELPLSVMNTQDYVAASSLIITKAGWGTIGEALVGHTPLILLKRDVKEDSEMTRILEERGLALSIGVEELEDFDYLQWKERITRELSLTDLSVIKNSNKEVARLLI